MMIWKANPVIVEALQEAGSLLHTEPLSHSYMHCWRHKTPVIYRATSQWFAGMDRQPKTGKTLRETALEGVDNTEFYPAWGRARLYAMIANRPDWTDRNSTRSSLHSLLRISSAVFCLKQITE